MKIAIELVQAHQLQPKHGHGVVNPYVEIEVDGKIYRTQTKFNDINPYWNETILVNILNTINMSDLDLVVYHERSSKHGRSLIGRLRLSGPSIAPSRLDAELLLCPLVRKRGLLSQDAGKISLRLYAVPENYEPTSSTTTVAVGRTNGSRRKRGERHDVQSIGTSLSSNTNKYLHRALSMYYDQIKPAVPLPAMQGWVSRQPQPQYMLVDAPPPPAARRSRFYDLFRDAKTFDLVEQAQYLYVSIVKARGLPSMDITGSVDHFVKVKVGNYSGKTKPLSMNQSPEWNEVFAFRKEHLQDHQLRVKLKNKGIISNGFVGGVKFELNDIPTRVPPDSPLAPQWFRLCDKNGEFIDQYSELMMAVWMGTQADEAYGNALHSATHSIPFSGVSHTRAKVYFSPKMCYLRVNVLSAQDLIPVKENRVNPLVYVEVQLGWQKTGTSFSRVQSMNPSWFQELTLVAYDPFDELVVITVLDRVEPGKDVPLAKLELSGKDIKPYDDYLKSKKPKPALWYNLSRPNISNDVANSTVFGSSRPSSKLQMSIYYDTSYHVLDETLHFCSDFQPSRRPLRKPTIGLLEIGIIGARGLAKMKNGVDRSTDAYCVAKYGPKWVRTRTILDSLSPQWNEQYSWEVHDPCTVVTVAVFDNCHVDGNGDGVKDNLLGKIRIRLSTLDIGQVYTHYYPLLLMHPSGLIKTGDLHLSIRFTCISWLSMCIQYMKPMLPRIHYVKPLPTGEFAMEGLRKQVVQIIVMKLSRAEPPLQRETIECILDKGSNLFSMRKSRSHRHRLLLLYSDFDAFLKWFADVQNWKKPIVTALVHLLFLLIISIPKLILPNVFLYMIIKGILNYRTRLRHPPHFDTVLSCAEFANPDDFGEELDSYPSMQPNDVVHQRYFKLRDVFGKIQDFVGDFANQMERIQSLLSWRDPRATKIFIMFVVMLCFIGYARPLKELLMLLVLYILRHPEFRSKKPSVYSNFFKRLPTNADVLL